MAAFEPALLKDRALVALSGPDAAAFLDNLVTNALGDLAEGGARFAALLSPQGKIQFEFFVLKTAAGFMLDVREDMAAALVKRLGFYRLRAKVEIRDMGRGVVVTPSQRDGGYGDPRVSALGFRVPLDATASGTTPAGDDALSYHAHRIALGVPEGGRDYVLGDTYPHEADYDLFNGVSFTKGCYVGQEVVSRMQNKTVVRKRVVKVQGAAPLAEGTAVLVGAADIGRVGSVDGSHGLAMLRLDRAAEAASKGQPLTAGGVVISPDAPAIARYVKSVAERPVIDL